MTIEGEARMVPIYPCPICKALTLDIDGHRKWHRTMTNQEAT